MSIPIALLFSLAFQTPALDLPKRFLAPKPKPDAVMAKVGGVPIRASDIESYLWDWRAYEVMQDAVTHQMIAAEAKKQKVVAADSEIQQELNRQLEGIKSQLKPGQTVQKAMLEQGFPKSRLYLRIKSEVLLNKLTMKSFDPKSYVKVSTIIIRARSEQTAELAVALKRADEAYAALRSGEPWSDVLSRYTDDTTTLQSQGLLGWRDMNAFPPTVRQEVAAMKPGAITKPAQTQNGIQIFRIEALGSSAEGPVLNDLKQSFLMGSRQKVLDQIRAKTPVEIFVGK